MTGDRHRRPLRSLRISVTDRCNLRCRYCMPEEDYVWLPRPSILRYEEIDRLARIFTGLGVTRIRLTGGEPLLRRDLHRLVRMIASIGTLQDIALTTNGVLLAPQAEALREAGLQRVTVSLDTLRPGRFEGATRSGAHARVVEGIEAARVAGLRPLKINSVVVRGFNDDELADLIRFGRARQAEIRFIEYMDVGGASRWSPEQVVPKREILERLAGAFGTVRPAAIEAAAGDDPAAPAERFVLPDGTRFGVIASTTEPFCGACDRSRLTADGRWYLCLYARNGIDLGTRLRAGAGAEAIAAAIREGWEGREARGAEERLGEILRAPSIGAAELRSNPHLEMHTRGG